MVGKVRTNIMYNFGTNQYQCGYQYPNLCKKYLIQFTNLQFIDHNKGLTISLLFIQRSTRGNWWFLLYAY